MNYPQTLDFLFSQLPMYQRIGKAAYKADLSATINLLNYLDNPQRHFKAVHIAGTNGKGSVAHMLASVLQTAGYTTALYTSPHLKDFRERIKINGKEIPEEYVIRFVEIHMSFFEKETLSFFEMTVGLDCVYFAEQKPDIAIIETGMGGRLDSTNLVNSLISIITNIGYDHTAFLGNSLAEIAAEKAGIIKEKQNVIIGEKHPETTSVFLDKAAKMQARILFAEDFYQCEKKAENFPYALYSIKELKSNKESFLELDLLGDYQEKNLQTTIMTVQHLREVGFSISEEKLKNGLKKTIENTALLGRWQFLQKNPLVICDTAHNKEGLSVVLSQLKKMNAARIHFVLGFVNDKNIDRILSLFPKEASYYFCQAGIPRAMKIDELQQMAEKLALKGKSYSSVQQAYQSAMQCAKHNEIVFVGGSTFVVAEVL
jgi:dihydrofolate synthase/folylpolyglutamate synthase